MSSLSQRLRLLNLPQGEATAPVDHLTLEELQNEVVTFGQKHTGSTFEDTWTDQEWVHFMINRYSKSQKESHKRYLKYVELKIESLEQSQMVIPRSSQGGGHGRPQSKAKAAAKTCAAPSVISSQGESEWAIPSEMYEPEIMNQQPLPATEDWMAMQSRMLNMENALTRVIRHLEDQIHQDLIPDPDCAP